MNIRLRRLIDNAKHHLGDVRERTSKQLTPCQRDLLLPAFDALASDLNVLDRYVVKIRTRLSEHVDINLLDELK